MKEFFNRIKEWFKSLFKKKEVVVEVKPEVKPVPVPDAPKPEVKPDLYKLEPKFAYSLYRDLSAYNILTKVYPAGLPTWWDWKEFDKVAKQPTHSSDGYPLDLLGNPILPNSGDFGPLPPATEEQEELRRKLFDKIKKGNPVSLDEFKAAGLDAVSGNQLYRQAVKDR